MHTALVTGAGGFLGKNLIQALSAQGTPVHALVRPGSATVFPDGVTMHELDITDAGAVERLFGVLSPQHVFHLAASNIRSGITAAPDDVVRTNVLGTHAVVEASAKAGAKSCIVMGSFLEYGVKATAQKEDMLCAPSELYSVSKLAATLFASAVGKRGAVPALAFRLFTPYGPGIQEKRLVREALQKALSGDSIQLTSPHITRDFMYVDDISALLIEAATHAHEHAGEIFNLGTGVKTSLKELADAVLEVTASKSEITWGEYGAVSYDADTWQADMTKTFAAFSWRPQVPLIEGLRKTADWLRASHAP